MGITRQGAIGLTWIAAGGLALAGLILLATRREPPRQVARLSLEAPAAVNYVGSPRISPDGRYVAFAAVESGGVGRIWLEPMDGSAARPLLGTEGASTPFWSPDSRFIGFVAARKLKTIDVHGGQPVTICDNLPLVGGVGYAGSWGSSGTILLCGWTIYAVSASGGQLAQVAWGDSSRGEVDAAPAWPQFLPDGQHFLYIAGIESKPESTALRLGRLDSKESEILAVGEFSRVEYMPPGYILYAKGRTLLARPFDAKRLRLSGDALPVVDDILRADLAGGANFSSSATGTLVYQDEWAGGKFRWVWMDRSGKQVGTLGPAGNYWFGIALSPDEKRAAVSMVMPGELNPDIWVYDVGRDVAIRLTSDPGIEIWPVWSPDGGAVYFSSVGFNGGEFRIHQRTASGIGDAHEVPMPPGSFAPHGVTPDSRFLFASSEAVGARPDIVKVPLDATTGVTGLGISPATRSPGSGYFSVSRDGRWIAYGSAETGRDEVYVVDCPALSAKWRVSVDGGRLPCWSADGRELFFLAPDWTLMSAAVSTVPAFQAARPSRAFAPGPGIGMSQYAPASDGKRILACVDAVGEKLPAMKVVLNWPEAARRR